jgi:hypothetical protein
VKTPKLLSALFIGVLGLVTLVTFQPVSADALSTAKNNCETASCIVVKIAGDTSGSVTVTATRQADKGNPITLNKVDGDSHTYGVFNLSPTNPPDAGQFTNNPAYIFKISVTHNGTLIADQPTTKIDPPRTNTPLPTITIPTAAADGSTPSQANKTGSINGGVYTQFGSDALTAAKQYTVSGVPTNTAAFTIASANNPNFTTNSTTLSTDGTFVPNPIDNVPVGTKYTVSGGVTDKSGNLYKYTLANVTIKTGTNNMFITLKKGDGNKIVATISDKTPLPTKTADTGAGSTKSDSNPELDCKWDSSLFGWFLCPITHLIINAVSGLDSTINTMLKIPDTVFTTTTDTKTGAGGYYTAWQSVRTLAIALLIIAGLVMVVAQAAGLELLDAYTVRKIAPRLLIMVIVMALSWPLLKFLVDLTNEVGLLTRSLIYGPFKNLDGGVFKLTSGAQGIGGLLALGGVTALGFMGVLSFAFTALLALFVGFLVLVLRQVVVTLLIVLSPIAIISYILPNTQKLYKFWWDALSKSLLMFPIIAGLIAAGRVFAVVSSSAASPSVGAAPGMAAIYQIAAVIAYIVPYFLLPLTVRFAGGALGTLGGFVNDRGKGAFDRLKKYRGGKAAQNYAALKAGDRFHGTKYIPGSQGLASGFGRASRGVASGAKGGFGMGRRGRAAEYQTTHRNAMEYMKSPEFDAIKDQEDTLRAQTYKTEGEARAGLASQWGKSQPEIDQAVAAAKANGGFGGHRGYAAARQLIQTGTGYENIQQLTETLGRVSGGNTSTASALAGFANSATKSTGRFDLAPGFANLNRLVQDQAANPGSVTRADYAMATVQASRGADAVSILRGKPKQVENFTKALADYSNDQYAAHEAALGNVATSRAAAQQARAQGDALTATALDAKADKDYKVAEQHWDEVLKTQGQIDQLKDAKSYASVENQTHVNNLLGNSSTDPKSRGVAEVRESVDRKVKLGELAEIPDQILPPKNGETPEQRNERNAKNFARQKRADDAHQARASNPEALFYQGSGARLKEASAPRMDPDNPRNQRPE